MWLREMKNLKNDTKGELGLPEMTNEALMFPIHFVLLFLRANNQASP
jgi:hypothetical protein